jgi:3',5'-nucleoside bisphosphate phosphatase
MLNLDLHCHSTHSDGLLRPAEVVARAAARGVLALALTDHDELGGLREAREHAERVGIAFVNGVEISVSWNGQTLHVVGLHVDPENAELAAGLGELRRGRRRRAKHIAARLEEAGFAGSLEGARAHVTNPELVSRTHFARFLIERGHASGMRSAFRKYLGVGKPGHVTHQWATLEQAVHWINVSGGMSVLAHPGRYSLDDAQRDALLGSFADLGGAAVEVVTGSHAPDQYAVWARRARVFGLLASVGSDFHGPIESHCDLGRLPELPAGCMPVWSRF